MRKVQKGEIEGIGMGKTLACEKWVKDPDTGSDRKLKRCVSLSSLLRKEFWDRTYSLGLQKVGTGTTNESCRTQFVFRRKRLTEF